MDLRSGRYRPGEGETEPKRAPAVPVGRPCGSHRRCRVAVRGESRASSIGSSSLPSVSSLMAGPSVSCSPPVPQSTTFSLRWFRRAHLLGSAAARPKARNGVCGAQSRRTKCVVGRGLARSASVWPQQKNASGSATPSAPRLAPSYGGIRRPQSECRTESATVIRPHCRLGDMTLGASRDLVEPDIQAPSRASRLWAASLDRA